MILDKKLFLKQQLLFYFGVNPYSGSYNLKFMRFATVVSFMILSIL